MARSARATQAVVSAGLGAAYTAADVAGETIPWSGGRAVLHVKNGSGASINVTVHDPVTVDGMAAPDRIVAVPAGADRFISLASSVYMQADGNVYVDYSAVTSVTAAALFH